MPFRSPSTRSSSRARQGLGHATGRSPRRQEASHVKNWILGGTFKFSTKTNDPLNAKFYIFQIQSDGTYKLVGNTVSHAWGGPASRRVAPVPQVPTCAHFATRVDTFIQLTLNGLTLGSVYALIALGYTLVYGVLKLLNFAHGDVFMVGSFIGFGALQRSAARRTRRCRSGCCSS